MEPWQNPETEKWYLGRVRIPSPQTTAVLFWASVGGIIGAILRWGIL